MSQRSRVDEVAAPALRPAFGTLQRHPWVVGAGHHDRWARQFAMRQQGADLELVGIGWPHQQDTRHVGEVERDRLNAVVRQPKLCATIRVGRRSWSSTSSRRSAQRSRTGSFQRSCSTRSRRGYRRCQRDCQCSGPLLCRPGATRTRNWFSCWIAMRPSVA